MGLQGPEEGHTVGAMGPQDRRRRLRGAQRRLGRPSGGLGRRLRVERRRYARRP